MAEFSNTYTSTKSLDHLMEVLDSSRKENKRSKHSNLLLFPWIKIWEHTLQKLLDGLVCGNQP